MTGGRIRGGLLSSALLTLALVAILLGAQGRSSVVRGAPGTAVGLDVDPTGNTATSLGSTEQCISVAPGQQFK